MHEQYNKIELCEGLLDAWLTLSATVRNERLVHSLTFREVCVCNILMHAQQAPSSNISKEMITATDIVNRTGMLKSQVNKVVTDLEKRGLITRQRFTQDKRQIGLALTKKGLDCYEKEHRDVLLILARLVDSIGAMQTSFITEQLNQISHTMQLLEAEREKGTK